MHTVDFTCQHLHDRVADGDAAERAVPSGKVRPAVVVFIYVNHGEAAHCCHGHGEHDLRVRVHLQLRNGETY